MDKSLTDTSNAAASGLLSPSVRDLTIVSAWEDVLANGLTFNYPLLKLLCRAHSLGHRVIITATTAKETMEDMFSLAIEFGHEQGHDLSLLNKIEFISKDDLTHLSAIGQMRVDIAFDSEDIATQTHLVRMGGDIFQRQRINYAQPQLEVRVHSNFSTTPGMVDVEALIRSPNGQTASPNQPREPH